MALTLTEAQRLLLGIITSVEAGVTTPEEAVEELNDLKDRAEEAGFPFDADYTLVDFENISRNDDFEGEFLDEEDLYHIEDDSE